MSPTRYGTTDLAPQMQQTGRRKFLERPGVVLFLWDVFLGIPIVYAITYTTKLLVEYLGYNKRLSGGEVVLYMRAMFVVLNVLIVSIWAVGLVAEEEKHVQKAEMEDEIEWWGWKLERLEALLLECREAEDKGPRRQIRKDELTDGGSVFMMGGREEDWERLVR